jgi:uncharacterized repeat protein (TIGR01451 family)
VGADLALRKTVIPQDILPGEPLQYRTWLTNTSATVVTGIVLVDVIDPRLQLLEVRASHGAAEVTDQSLIIHVGTLEVGESALILTNTLLSASARSGEIILNQTTAHFDGGQVSSNVVAAGLPPAELPATGEDGREP